MGNRILIIDDEVQLRGLLSRIISLEGYEVVEAGDCRTGLKQLESFAPEVVLCDVRLPDGNGVEMVEKIRQAAPQTEVILLTAYGNIPDGVQAIKNGAFDYITKGDDNNKILPLLSRAVEKVEMSRRLAQLEKQVGEKFSFDTVLGNSPAIREAIELARKVAATDATVLVTGETGTGKEVFAQAIHQNSARAKRSFVAVNCSAFSKELLESELFGHRAGAFTGAVKDKKGLFEEASGGTIFLDEIGEMAFDLQAKLLRVIESGEFIKVGETRPTKVDVRIVAATNRDLKQEIAEGRFREDLYYRLSVFRIHLPPLRERPEDIEAYVRMFAGRFGMKMGRRVEHIEPEYLERLRLHGWPGNVRELRNVVERSLIMAEGTVLRAADLPLEMQRSDASGRPAGGEALDLASVEREHIARVLRRTGGNKTRTAALLGIGLTTLYRKIEEYGL
ncbi:sigma-54-dependent transcriptional regulator [Rikenella microfusus]|uniref:Nitrogen regulation protein NR(I) n=1 Tax=Rikenella microfusus TaxID=28139 RepID=A0A379MTT7_9BACT|nr:sigma-54 dependent transcriptional regulator [Rikenella microfusus]SUE34943.1 Nitrogen regulation protein NR(I) [Rikenella microfusus]HJE88252.1 sigma-54 dependent transcriptional regulator [Rikenella microfusus]